MLVCLLLSLLGSGPIYDSALYSVRMEFPSGWQILMKDKKERGIRVAVRAAVPERRMTLQALGLTRKILASEAGDAIAYQLSSQGQDPGLTPYGKTEVILNEDVRAWRYELSSRPMGVEVHYVVYAVSHHGSLLMFNFSAPNKQETEVFDQIMRSAHWMPTQRSQGISALYKQVAKTDPDWNQIEDLIKQGVGLDIWHAWNGPILLEPVVKRRVGVVRRLLEMGANSSQTYASRQLTDLTDSPAIIRLLQKQLPSGSAPVRQIKNLSEAVYWGLPNEVEMFLENGSESRNTLIETARRNLREFEEAGLDPSPHLHIIKMLEGTLRQAK